MGKISKIKIKKGNDFEEHSLTIDPSDFLDIFYPVGCYFETSDVLFDPNEEWGGTWEEDIDGTVLVSYGMRNPDTTAYYDYGITFGSRYITLTTAHIPSHTHSFSGTTTSTTLTGSVQSNALNAAAGTGLFNTASGIISRDSAGSGYYDNTDRVAIDNLNNRLTINATHTHTFSGTTGSAGTGSSNIDVAQPSTVVARWHRIA